MTKRVNFGRYISSLAINIYNFDFEVEVILGLESTIPEGRQAGRTEKLGIEPATAQLELGLGLSLAIFCLHSSFFFKGLLH